MPRKSSSQASRYLDLSGIRSSERTVKGPELAKQLEALLDNDPRFEVQVLSDRPEGNLEDGLAPDRDVLVTIQSNGSPETLDLQRTGPQDARIWLVSEQSVELIPSLGALAGESAIEKRLPEVLVERNFSERHFGPGWRWCSSPWFFPRSRAGSRES